MTSDEISFKPVLGNVMPRFSGIATFMRLPYVKDPKGVDIGLIGVPWDGGTTNRAGARHGPRQIRDLSTMMRNVHHVSRIKTSSSPSAPTWGTCRSTRSISRTR